MPIYAYRCASCGHARDVLQKVSDPPLTVAYCEEVVLNWPPLTVPKLPNALLPSPPPTVVMLPLV